MDPRVVRRGRGSRALVACLVASALLAIPASPAGASFAGRNGLIAFSAGGISVMRSDGRYVRRLTRWNKPYDYGPAWSPDGRKLLFMRDVYGRQGVDSYMFRLHFASGAKKMISGPHDTGYSPSWSPTGKKIAVVRGSTLWIMSGRGHYRHYVFGRSRTYSVDDAEWAPDRRRIACSFGGHVWTVRPDGTDARQLTFGRRADFGPTWSPDAQRIAFTRFSSDGLDAGIWQIEADGSGLERLRSGGAGPVYSLNGRLLAFNPYTARPRMKVLDLATSDVSALSDRFGSDLAWRSR